MTPYKLIGISVFIYCVYALYTGEVVAKDKVSMQTIVRSERPGYFIAVIACYLLLAGACFFIF
jgi:hypothetical protein